MINLFPSKFCVLLLSETNHLENIQVLGPWIRKKKKKIPVLFSDFTGKQTDNFWAMTKYWVRTSTYQGVVIQVHLPSEWAPRCSHRKLLPTLNFPFPIFLKDLQLACKEWKQVFSLVCCNNSHLFLCVCFMCTIASALTQRELIMLV